MDPVIAPAPPVDLRPRDEAPSMSVVIPVYQGAATIAETLRSVLAQRRPPDEVIVSDDGSTDALADALSPFRDAISVVHNEHRGVAAARNAGVAAACGEFVLIVDADDVLFDRKIEALCELGRQRPDLDLLSTDVCFEVDGRHVGRFSEHNPFAVDDQRVAILRSCFVGWPAVRRDALVDCGGFDETLSSSADWECWARVILAGARAGLVDEPLSSYRVHGESLTAKRVAVLQERVMAFSKLAGSTNLTEPERAVLADLVAAHRARAAAAEAQEAVLSGAPGARWRCVRAAAAAQDTGARVRFMCASVLPSGLRRRAVDHGGSLLTRVIPPVPPVR